MRLRQVACDVGGRRTMQKMISQLRANTRREWPSHYDNDNEIAIATPPRVAAFCPYACESARGAHVRGDVFI